MYGIMYNFTEYVLSVYAWMKEIIMVQVKLLNELVQTKVIIMLSNKTPNISQPIIKYFS